MAKTNSGLLEFKDAQKVLIALDDATSEVKKAVVIDGDGVETDIKGVQPTGKKEITSTAEVNVTNYATAQVVDEDLVAGNIKKDVDILGVVGSYEGGGGSSDYSTAKVTLTNETMFALALAYIDNTNGVVSQMGTSGEYDVVLYKGKAEGFLLAPSASASVTGNITFDNDTYEFVITGDGTITISE